MCVKVAIVQTAPQLFAPFLGLGSGFEISRILSGHLSILFSFFSK